VEYYSEKQLIKTAAMGVRFPLPTLLTTIKKNELPTMVIKDRKDGTFHKFQFLTSLVSVAKKAIPNADFS
jgi:hypothetical protein